MVSTLKIADEDMGYLRKAAVLNSLSLAGQASHWMRLGRAVETSPDMTVSRVQQALRGEIKFSQLSDPEQEVYFQELDDFLNQPFAKEEVVFARIAREWQGVTHEDEDGLSDSRVV